MAVTGQERFGDHVRIGRPRRLLEPLLGGHAPKREVRREPQPAVLASEQGQQAIDGALNSAADKSLTCPPADCRIGIAHQPHQRRTDRLSRVESEQMRGKGANRGVLGRGDVNQQRRLRLGPKLIEQRQRPNLNGRIVRPGGGDQLGLPLGSGRRFHAGRDLPGPGRLHLRQLE